MELSVNSDTLKDATHKKSQSNWIAAPLGILGITSISFFALGTPKIYSLLIQFGQYKLQLGRLEKEVEIKKGAVAELEMQIGILEAKRVVNLVGSQLAAAQNSGKSFIELSPQGLAIHKSVLAQKKILDSSWQNQIEKLLPGQWLVILPNSFELKTFSKSQEKKAYVVDPSFSRSVPLRLESGSIEQLFQKMKETEFNSKDGPGDANK